MKVVGFTIANNAVRLGYPIEESLRSLLPLVDEIVVNVGEADQETWDLIASLGEPKIKPFRSWWDPDMRFGGQILAQQTNLALERLTGDWGIYLQADEVLHERDYPAIRAAMEKHLHRNTEALRFQYHHFYGSFETIQDYPQRWYRSAIRAVKLGVGATSRGDAMDFGVRRDGREWDLRYADVDAYVYHYGWSRPPSVMRTKRDAFERLYHDDASFEKAFGAAAAQEIYHERGNLRFFRGTHPAVMRERVASRNWTFDHQIERQKPDWLRHTLVWMDLYRRRLWPFAQKMGRRFGRLVSEAHGGK